MGQTFLKNNGSFAFVKDSDRNLSGPDSLSVLNWNFWSQLLPLPQLAVLQRACYCFVEHQPGFERTRCPCCVVQCYCWICSKTLVPRVDGQRAKYRLVTWWKLVPCGFFLRHWFIDLGKQWLLTDPQTSSLIGDVTDLLSASAACVIIDWPFAFWHKMLKVLLLLRSQRQLIQLPLIMQIWMMTMIMLGKSGATHHPGFLLWGGLGCWLL